MGPIAPFTHLLVRVTSERFQPILGLHPMALIGQIIKPTLKMVLVGRSRFGHAMSYYPIYGI